MGSPHSLIRSFSAKLGKWFAASALSLLTTSLMVSHANAQINEVRLWHAPDHSRLVFDLSKQISHKIFTLEAPNRLVIDIKDVPNYDQFAALDTSVGPIRRMRSGVRNKKDLRVVLDLNSSVKPRSFYLKPNEKYGHRLVVDIFPDQLDKILEPFLTDDLKAQQQRDIVIAIDAGHGGEDPGAVGHKKVYEKVVVLKIAKELEKLLKREKGFKPLLVRTGDYYLDHRRRTQIAREANADLFMSIHADAFHDRRANGASVYALSERGATSETARWLADKENASDLIGGVGSVRLDNKSKVLAGVLIDLSMSASLQSSLKVGSKVLGNMGTVARLHKKQVEQANFLVLKAPDVPSILVETGFISNPKEAQKLGRSSYQKSMAKSLFRGIKQYFNDSPPPGTWLAFQRKNSPIMRDYTILPGDTLSQIAERNRTTTVAIRKLNGLKDDNIRVGQVIRLPNT